MRSAAEPARRVPPLSTASVVSWARWSAGTLYHTSPRLSCRSRMGATRGVRAFHATPVPAEAGADGVIGQDTVCSQAEHASLAVHSGRSGRTLRISAAQRGEDMGPQDRLSREDASSATGGIKGAVRQQFAGVAAQYTTSSVHAGGPDLAALVAAVPPASTRILDVGCGPGHTTLAVAGRAASVVGIDLTDEMLVQARRLAA